MDIEQGHGKKPVSFFGSRKWLHIVLAILTFGAWLIVPLTIWLWRTDRRRGAAISGGVGALLVVIIAISSATSGSSTDSNSPSSSADAAPTTATPAATPTVASPPSPNFALTGFGATNAAWNATHQADSQFDPGSAYDWDPSLARAGVDERFVDRYYAVEHTGGRVTDYEMRFPPGTGVQEAKRSVLASEFPSDAKIAWFKQLGTCAQMLVRSKKVARATHSAALIEFSSGAGGDQYDASDVWDAIVLPGGSGLGC